MSWAALPWMEPREIEPFFSCFLFLSFGLFCSLTHSLTHFCHFILEKEKERERETGGQRQERKRNRDDEDIQNWGADAEIAIDGIGTLEGKKKGCNTCLACWMLDWSTTHRTDFGLAHQKKKKTLIPTNRARVYSNNYLPSLTMPCHAMSCMQQIRKEWYQWWYISWYWRMICLVYLVSLFSLFFLFLFFSFPMVQGRDGWYEWMVWMDRLGYLDKYKHSINNDTPLSLSSVHDMCLRHACWAFYNYLHSPLQSQSNTEQATITTS